MNVLEIVQPCPECGERILRCENVWLDPASKPAALDRFQVVVAGHHAIAARDARHGRGHDPHRHQPPEVPA